MLLVSGEGSTRFQGSLLHRRVSIPWYRDAGEQMAHPAPMARRAKARRDTRVTQARARVAVVDDDESVRESLPDLLRTLGFAAKAFASAQDFLASDCIAVTRCLLLDVAMPGMSGPELHRHLALRKPAIAIIYITARADEGLRQQLLREGAVECLFKPFSEEQLRVALDAALQGI